MQVFNWGIFPKAEASQISTDRSAAVPELIRQHSSLIARGNGRCYGDSSLHHSIFSTLRLNHFLDFDKTNGTIRCEAGVLLSEILELIVPEGFFLPVVPGTRMISLGGAIASDVHGKNHSHSGSFSRHIISFDLLRSDGEISTCSATENEKLFRHTCGGMGLTGIILRAEIRLMKIETAFVRQRTIKTKNLSETLRAFQDHAASSYAVAWIDCMAGEKKSGRGILTTGEHSKKNELPHSQKNPLALRKKTGFGIPFFFPSFVLNAWSIRFLNRLIYANGKTDRQEKTVHYEPFFFPLDGIANWNRAYGKNGFLQYQFVLPFEESETGLTEILDCVRKSRQQPFLPVLKYFGKADPGFPMSFPMHGFSLAMDFKFSPEVFLLMDELDKIVLKYKGRLYLTKDARMKAAMFHQSYPEPIERDRFFQSMQSVRLGN